MCFYTGHARYIYTGHARHIDAQSVVCVCVLRACLFGLAGGGGGGESGFICKHFNPKFCAMNNVCARLALSSNAKLDESVSSFSRGLKGLRDRDFLDFWPKLS